MGQLISGPVTFKDTKLGQNSQYSVAASSMQGWRVRMEDYYSCFLSLSTTSASSTPTAYFAVFDGHGGTKVSEYAAAHLHDYIMSRPAYSKGDISEAMCQGICDLDSDMQVKFTGMSLRSSAKRNSACVTTDHALLEEGKPNNADVGGSTCIALLLREKKIFCANCGDSRAVLSRLGIAETLSVDHKPTMASEWVRIVGAGGWVAGNRVNGNLALSRALGDFKYKTNPLLAPDEQIISAKPDVSEFELKDNPSGEDEFIVIGCDGIWDVMSNQEVVSFVRHRLANGYPPDSICEELMMQCLAPDCNPNGLGCDNMTVVIVCFLNGATYSELQQRCSRPCPGGDTIDVLSN